MLSKKTATILLTILSACILLAFAGAAFAGEGLEPSVSVSVGISTDGGKTVKNGSTSLESGIGWAKISYNKTTEKVTLSATTKTCPYGGTHKFVGWYVTNGAGNNNMGYTYTTKLLSTSPTFTCGLSSLGNKKGGAPSATAYFDYSAKCNKISCCRIENPNK
jgi:hypothetical protein